MTPRISLITGVVAAALAAYVPAAFGDSWGADRQSPTALVGSPDVVDRAVAAEQQMRVVTMLDARERALATKYEARLGSGAFPDAFERRVQARRTTGNHFVANDNRFRVTPASDPVTVPVAGPRPELEWPQIGFGIVVGILSALGLMLALRTARGRQLAH